MSNLSGKIIYLGDSENDNPDFRKADISIGVISDNRLNPKLVAHLPSTLRIYLLF
jgi:soluble P-type ATPase